MKDKRPMTDSAKLALIKILHTLIWIFFNVVIFYMLYAVIIDKIDVWLWVGYRLFVLEGLVLLAFRFYCPLTVLARRFSDSSRDNFDIYLPNWLAKHNKRIYTSLLIVIMILTVYRVAGVRPLLWDFPALTCGKIKIIGYI